MGKNRQPKDLIPLLWFITSFICLTCRTPLLAASFDCQQAVTLVEKTVCADTDLSRLDEELANKYAQALRTIADKQALIADQKAWLKTRDTCEKFGEERDPPVECLLYQYRKRSIEIQHLLEAPPEHVALTPARRGAPKGEFVLTRVDNTRIRFCHDYTRNLNQFRHLDFIEPNPRLSTKYPQFSRPHWEEIPLDLKVAEEVILSESGHPLWGGDDSGPRAWEDWLQWTEPLRASGKVRLWQTRIDIDGDGRLDTLVRLYPIVRPQDEIRLQEISYLSWLPESGLICLLPGPGTHEYAVKNFNREPVFDIVHDYASNAYYTVALNMDGPAEYIYAGWLMGSAPGAISGVAIRRMVEVGGGIERYMNTECLIDWVK